MEKLVELLNEFEKEKIINDLWYVDEDTEYFWRSIEYWKIVNWGYDTDAHWFFKYQIISKDFKFIERLVKKDKIDLQKVMEQNKNWYDITRVNPDDNFIDNAIEYDDELDLFIIMLLAISDEPLQFLSQIIK